MNTSTLQPGMLCLRMSAQASSRAPTLSSHFSSMTRARLHLLRQSAIKPSTSHYAAGASSRVITNTSRARFASSSAASTSSTTSPNATMPWAEYFKLRRSRRVWGTVAAIPTTLAGVMIGGGALASLNSQRSGSQTLIYLMCGWYRLLR